MINLSSFRGFYVMSIRLIVVDDHHVIRKGLREVFTDTEIEVCAEASNVTEAIHAVSSTKFDVILLDVRIPGGDALRTESEKK